jgi:hypothetical protein
MRLEGLEQLMTPVIFTGIEPPTFRLVTNTHTHTHTHTYIYIYIYIYIYKGGEEKESKWEISESRSQCSFGLGYVVPFYQYIVG